MKIQKMDLIRSLKWLTQILILSVILYFFLGEVILPKETVDDLRCEEFSIPWTLYHEDGTSLPVTLPGTYDAARNELLILEATLPEDIEPNLYLCWRSNRQDLNIYVDGQLRQSFSTEDSRPFGHASASAYIFMRVEAGDQGKMIRVEYLSNSAYTGKFRSIYYGDKMGIWTYLFRKYGGELSIALLMLVLGFISIVGSAILRFCYRNPVELEYLSWSVFMAACWIIANSTFRQLLFPNISMVNDFAFFMVMLLPLPFMLYINEVQKRRYNKWYIAAITLVTLNMVICTALQICNLVDFTDSIVSTAVFCVMSISLIGATIVTDVINKNIKQYQLVAVGIMGASLAAVAQFALYFQRNIAFNGVMIAIGLIFLLAISIANTVRDIFRMENEKQQAIFASESKAKFLANMSHEIRTPINAVLGMDEMILKEATETNIKEYATDIQNAGQSLLALINDILDFTKIESGKMEIVPTNYDLSSLLSDSYNMVSMRAQDKHLQFHVQNDHSLPAKLLGDEVRVRQIIVNLLTNAIKYTKSGSVTMDVTGTRTDDKTLLLQIAVKDTGIGITPENQSKLFDSFQRVDEKRNRNIEGTGLGLAITKQLVDLMGGSISVESEYGKGSTFCVKLPQTIVNDQPMGAFSSHVEREVDIMDQPPKKFIAPEGRILVVDDVSMNLKVFCGLLKNSQLHIDTAESGKAALELMKHNHYHLIFLDHMMPEMDGIETFHALKNLESSPNSDTPVVMLTANAILGVRDEYINEGFTDYLSKPIQIQQLEAILFQYMPPSLILKQVSVSADSEEKGAVSVSVLSELDFLDTQAGLMYCADSEEFYLEILKTYVESDKSAGLKQFFQEEDWDHYRILAHSLKSASLSIGAKQLSEQAKALEFAVKDGNISYVKEEHGVFLAEYEDLLNKLRQILL